MNQASEGTDHLGVPRGWSNDIDNRISFEDYDFGAEGAIRLECDGSPCLRPQGRVEDRVRVRPHRGPAERRQVRRERRGEHRSHDRHPDRPAQRGAAQTHQELADEKAINRECDSAEDHRTSFR